MSIKTIVANKGTIFTMDQVVNATEAKEYDFYYAVKINNTAYAVSKELILKESTNDAFKLKVSKSGQWLVPNSSADFVLKLDVV